MIHLIIVEIEGNGEEQVKNISVTLAVNYQDGCAPRRHQDHPRPASSLEVPPDNHLIIIYYRMFDFVPLHSVPYFRCSLFIQEFCRVTAHEDHARLLSKFSF